MSIYSGQFLIRVGDRFYFFYSDLFRRRRFVSGPNNTTRVLIPFQVKVLHVTMRF